MTKRASRSRKKNDAVAPAAGIGIPNPVSGGPMDHTTGRYLVLLEPHSVDAASKDLQDRIGLQLASAGDFSKDGQINALETDHGVVFEDLGVAIVSTLPEKGAEMQAMAASHEHISMVEPERFVFALSSDLEAAYVRGYRDGVNHLAEQILADGRANAVAPRYFDEAQLAWGLQAIGADASHLTGRGIRVAVLDTGFDLGHQDYVGRTIKSASFIAGQPVQDAHGHGTHCAGIACGPANPKRPPRYGVASEADLYIGKVLDNSGRGVDGNIIAGIKWALDNDCAIISMSLGSPVASGQGYSRVFEQIAARVLERGALIVAAAGNDSHRPGRLAPLNHPANCPSVLAVGAVDQRLEPAWFSNSSLNQNGDGQIGIAAPGVDVMSSWPSPFLYRAISGTSMATPYVAGVAALLAQASPNSRGVALRESLLKFVRKLPGAAADVGAGLLQVPSGGSARPS